jgi:hypothetical protein
VIDERNKQKKRERRRDVRENGRKKTKKTKHLPVGCVERLFDTVAVVNVNVDVQDARMILQQLQSSENDVVDIAETARLE